MTGPTPDPLLALIVRGRPLDVNNDYRAKLIAEAAITQRRDPQGFVTFVLQHLQWSQAEAIARDRAGQDLDSLPLLSHERQVLLLPHAVRP